MLAFLTPYLTKIGIAAAALAVCVMVWLYVGKLKAENAAQAHLTNTRSVETSARSKVTAQQTVVKDAQAALTTANNLVTNLLKQLAAL